MKLSSLPDESERQDDGDDDPARIEVPGALGELDHDPEHDKGEDVVDEGSEEDGLPGNGVQLFVLREYFDGDRHGRRREGDAGGKAVRVDACDVSHGLGCTKC